MVNAAAYLTAEYGHENPGTVVDLELVGGALSVARTNVYPPGTSTLSGVVTEVTPTGVVPVSGVTVALGVGSGWRWSVTDANGAYEIRGLYPSNPIVYASRTGYRESQQEVVISGHTTYNIGLVGR